MNAIFQIDELPTDQSPVDFDAVDVTGKCLLAIYIELRICIVNGRPSQLLLSSCLALICSEVSIPHFTQKMSGNG